jgi:hypothetical protein
MELAATLTAYKTLPRKSTPRRPSHHWCWWTLTLTQLQAGGLNGALGSSPNVLSPTISIKVPPAMLEKLESVWAFMWKMGLGHSKIQEFLGELATGIVIHAIGYELPSLTLDAVHGPDQVARHSGTGVWGVFEAKGGKARLGTEMTNMGGPQMSHAWIKGWIKHLIDKNKGSEYGKKLETSFDDRDSMLAAVTRMRVTNAEGYTIPGAKKKIDAEFEVIAQKFEPNQPGQFKSWGGNW